MKNLVRKCIKGILRVLPNGTPEKLYATFFRGRLGKLVNPLIMLLIPKVAIIPEGKVVLNPNDPAVSGAVAFGAFEPYESELFRSVIKDGMTVIDIGANIGYYTVIAARRVGLSGSVIAFEPAPENFKILQETIEANNFENVQAFEVAVADKDGMLNLNLFDSNKGKHSLVKDVQDSRGFSTSIHVRTICLDAFLVQHQINNVDFIKMDIEGAESLALQGMQSTLDKTRGMFLEFTPETIRRAGHDPKEILSMLRVKGFSIYLISESGRLKVKVLNDNELISSIPSTECANLYCEKA